MENFPSRQGWLVGIRGLHSADFLHRRWWIIIVAVIVVVIALVVMTVSGLAPAGSGNVAPVMIHVVLGQSFLQIARTLDSMHLLRSRLAFEVAAFMSGAAFRIQPRTYRLSPVMSGGAILRALSSGTPTVTVTIPEGFTIYEIDKALADAGVITRGDLINFAGDGNLEGNFFPDTYQFFEGSDVSVVVKKFLDNFNEKAAQLFAADPKHEEQDLTLASILEKEARDPHDQSIIAGIILKRMADGMRLQLDPTVCYAKQIALPSEILDCSTLTRVDFTANSPYDGAYNTYIHAGLPPGPIGNPGIAAITAALYPIRSPYWYYLSDPTTGKIIYAATLAEQNANIKKYLGN